ncbi:hypothetical protein QBC44DRAFT_324840 [Cladorrhinum sp. PSN332]|nr:hypothetical protein QBC44DRAFT_324840 [Cladorrhinum sp. PSN332]
MLGFTLGLFFLFFFFIFFTRRVVFIPSSYPILLLQISSFFFFLLYSFYHSRDRKPFSFCLFSLQIAEEPGNEDDWRG